MAGEEENGGKSHLRLAVENDQQDVDREWARQRIEWPLRDLAANILRVVRGAGKSYEIGRQCAAVLKAFEEYRDKVGHWPTSFEMDEALSIRKESQDNETYDEYWQREQAHETILRGALQVGASRLVGQLTQERRGESEMVDGLRDIEQIREERRARYAEEERAKRASSKASTKSAKRKVSAGRLLREPKL